jgi:uncharacterized membrane protein YqjE
LPSQRQEASTAELLTRLSEQSNRLVRDELALLRLELNEKAKRFGLGAGMFSAAGVLALYGLGALVATAILALALAVDAWLAALIVTVVLFAAAGVAALMGKKQVDEGMPAAPQETLESVKQDVDTVRRHAKEGRS